MGATGIRRKVDDLGRIVIPAGIRRSLSIGEGDELEVTVDGDRVVLSKHADRCTFCGVAEPSLQSFQGKPICRGCVAAVGRLDAGASRGRPPAAVPDGPRDGDPGSVEPDSRGAAARRGPDRDQAPASTTAW